MNFKKTFEVVLDPNELDTQDGGCAKIMTLQMPSQEGFPSGSDGTSQMFLRLQSWDEEKDHEEFNAILGKTVRITIEALA